MVPNDLKPKPEYAKPKYSLIEVLAASILIFYAVNIAFGFASTYWPNKFKRVCALFTCLTPLQNEGIDNEP